MADEKQKEGQKGKLSNRFILIVIMLILLGGGGAFGYVKFIKPKLNIKQDQSHKDTKLIPMTLDPYLVNLIDPDTRRYLKLRMVLNLSSKDVKDEVKRNLPRISDSIVMLLTSKTYNEVISPVGKKKLKKQIMKIINSNIQKGSVKQIFFTEFLVQ